MKKIISRTNIKKTVRKILPSIFVIVFAFTSIFGLTLSNHFFANAQVNSLTSPVTTENPTKPGFRIVVCDGPYLPTQKLRDQAQAQIDQNAINTGVARHDYVVCDFGGAMIQVQHFINIAMVLGVFAAIILFTYAGVLMIKGGESDRSKAKEIFPKIFWGFVIMLTAWFIVYQILSWLTGDQIFTKLLGNP